MYTFDWFTRNIPVWEEALKDYKDKPIQALEIGSFEGRATVWLCENILTHNDSYIICVDPFKPYSDLDKENIDWKIVEERFKENIKKFGDKVELWKIDSTDLRHADLDQFDFIYVDGAHTSAQCLIDATLSHILLKKGGTIIFDDYLWGTLVKAPNVPRAAIDAFMECFAEQYEPVYSGYQVILRKK